MGTQALTALQSKWGDIRHVPKNYIKIDRENNIFSDSLITKHFHLFQSGPLVDKPQMSER
jgi:hypothetical protein